MKVYRKLSEFKPLDKAVVTVGTFDGVHKGHQVLLDRIKNIAREDGGEAVMLTFFPHPRLVLFPDDNDLRLLTTLEEKIELLESSGIDHLIIHPFTLEFSRTTVPEYVRDILVKGIGVHKLVIGYDHHFGRNREGSLENLRAMAPDYGFEVEEIPARMIDDVKVSSTKIRNALLEGNVARANGYLGYPYTLTGLVVRGNEIGRSMGFPTANVEPSETGKLIPGNGVYAVKVHFEDCIYHGMANIGKRPTVVRDTAQRVIEVHIFGFSSDLYGKNLRLTFHGRIRDEVKFEDTEALKAQIEKDATAARQILADSAYTD
ncbi:MAG: bifunctional riboflavin kinase/FAD synthetase [Flavobacteriales bacterium]|nr:bifunctional riboflavin kinase/FAD synthetase [Flavobacteriales bacterium]